MRRVALVALGLGAPIALVALVAGGELSSWAFGLVAALYPAALVGLAARRGPLPSVAAAGFAALLGAGGGVVLAFGGDPDAPSLAGLPLTAWAMVLLLWLLPLLLTCAIALVERRREHGS